MAAQPAASAQASGGYGSAAAAPVAPAVAAGGAAGAAAAVRQAADQDAWHVAGGFRVGEQVQYWSDSKNRWVDTAVEAVRTKDGAMVYDLTCKKGAAADKVRSSQ